MMMPSRPARWALLGALAALAGCGASDDGQPNADVVYTNANVITIVRK